MTLYTKKVIILGTGDNAELLRFFIKDCGMGEVEAFAVDRQFIEESVFCDLPVVALDDLPRVHPPSSHCVVNAVGYRQMNALRSRMSRDVKAMGYEMPGFVHPSAEVASNVRTGANFIAFEKVVVEPFTTIGDDVFLWGGVFIAHHCCVDDACFFAPRAALAGNVVVGKKCFVGANATVRARVTLAEQCLIGAGACISRSTEPGTIYRPPPSLPVQGKRSADIDDLY